MPVITCIIDGINTCYDGYYSLFIIVTKVGVNKSKV